MCNYARLGEGCEIWCSQPLNRADRLLGWEADMTQGRSYSLSVRLSSLTRTSVWEARQGDDSGDKMCAWNQRYIHALRKRCREVSAVCVVVCVFSPALHARVYVRAFMHACVSNCAAPAQCSWSLHGDRSLWIWHLRAQTRAKESGMLSVGSSGMEADCRSITLTLSLKASVK